MEDAGRRAGENTQALVLSQWARDATGLGVMVAADTYLCPLGATFDRLLHFGTHWTNIRKRVRPRIVQLRRMTGRSRDLGYRQLKALANDYVRGTLHLSTQPESRCPCRLLHISTSSTESCEPQPGWSRVSGLDAGPRPDGRGGNLHCPLSPCGPVGDDAGPGDSAAAGEGRPL